MRMSLHWKIFIKNAKKDPIYYMWWKIRIIKYMVHSVLLRDGKIIITIMSILRIEHLYFI